ncbi:hypothetical protein BDV41DRAFT_307358 [Aspergillus transmontanensis]|uniref:Secreted protein n=1 Tax=Aspergillus transmontanensis TaxID=1034304 RepID=A0A5N6VV47_9EURO|nr:hypothetical protein BDV41DRAFT_307358 [Aspergillus transmontanensis]
MLSRNKTFFFFFFFLLDGAKGGWGAVVLLIVTCEAHFELSTILYNEKYRLYLRYTMKLPFQSTDTLSYFSTHSLAQSLN